MRLPAVRLRQVRQMLSPLRARSLGIPLPVGYRLLPERVSLRPRAIQTLPTHSHPVRSLVQQQATHRIHRTPLVLMPFQVVLVPFPVARVPFPVVRVPFPVVLVPFPVVLVPFPVARVPFPEQAKGKRAVVRLARQMERVPLAPENLEDRGPEDRELVNSRRARPKTRFRSSALPCRKAT